ncbi:hypothetical protein C7N43_00155 [Sphingobacteriales bacterium UPWRP_1]|nr:hypothetical protein BVG80_15085 [Sphingobacteriales bacterium TSM_CSM]PSJ79073.1 hypothetical protein C7N43_00155 [Sphingobacteriales bacterium UPWRP_1]
MFSSLTQYIVITYLLSCLGVSLYLLFAKVKLNALLQKGALLGIVVFSLALPPVVDKFSSSWEGSNYQPCLHQHPIPEVLLTQYCPESGQEMEMCIEIANKAEHFCSCPRITQENLLLYKANPTYDWLLQHEQPLKKVFLALAVLLLGSLLLKTGYLYYVVITSGKKTIYRNNSRFIILYPPGQMSVCSFRLHRKYIVWHRYLDLLPAAEQEAVLWHEISHLQQKDTWFKMLLHLLQPLWLLNPAYYFVVNELERINEFIADEFAVSKTGNAQWYATLLLKLKTQKQLPLAHSFANKKTSRLKQRVQYLLGSRRRSFIQWALTLAFTTLAAISLSGMAFYTMPDVSEQFDKIKLYQQLNLENKKTGKSVFCKNCLTKNAFEQPVPSQPVNSWAPNF